jgi:aconitate hydratase
MVATALKGRRVAPSVTLSIAPGSRQVLEMLSRNGMLADMIGAGARILETGCGPCIGQGQSPADDTVTLRTFNRNFAGRTGTKGDQAYLVSPETAVISALTGYFTDPRKAEFDYPVIEKVEQFLINDNMIIRPEVAESTEIVRKRTIGAPPVNQALPEKIDGVVAIKVGDKITTDHIMPSNASLLPYRSNIPYLADYCLTPSDSEFPSKAKASQGGIIVAGENYGQGSSREHAALAPLYLGVKAVIAKSFARIHKQNLVNNGIIPLTFVHSEDYANLQQDDELVFTDLLAQISAGKVVMLNKTSGKEIELQIDLGERQEKLLLAGGLLTSIRNHKE